MRETYSTLLQASQDFCVDASTDSKTSLSASSSFLSRRINDTITHLFSLIRNYKTQPLPKTMDTVEDQIYYHYPPGLLNIESVTMAIGDIDYPLRVVNSQQKWDSFQQIDITSADVPQYFFPRRDDFGIWPTPAEDDLEVTLVGNFLPRRINVADYISGTVSTTNGDETVTGVSTTFTSAMVGRWFCEADSNGEAIGNWYRIASYTSAVSIELETSFEETALATSKYIIAQSPDLPEELHSFIPYHAAAAYYSTVRRDRTQAQSLLNYFYTGDFYNAQRQGGIKGGVLGIINRYKNTGRDNSQITRLHKGAYPHWRDEAWATTLSTA